MGGASFRGGAVMFRQVLDFLNPLKPHGGKVGRVTGPLALLVALATLALVIVPGSPLRPGTELAQQESDLAGELAAIDIAAAGVGAGVDYGTPSEYLTANGLRFAYYAPNVPHYGYPTGTHGQNDPITIVVHVAGGSCSGMRNWFQNSISRASSQFGVCNDGSIEQYVEIEDAAYTQGIVNSPSPYISVYGGINPNLRSVSIELEGCGSGDFAPMAEKPRQEVSLRLLLRWLSDQIGIPLDRQHVLGHFDIDSINRASDPLCVILDFDGFVASLQPSPTPVATPAPIPASNCINRAPLLIQRPSGEPAIYAVYAGLLIHIPDPPTFEALDYCWSEVRTIAADNRLWGLPIVEAQNWAQWWVPW